MCRGFRHKACRVSYASYAVSRFCEKVDEITVTAGISNNPWHPAPEKNQLHKATSQHLMSHDQQVRKCWQQNAERCMFAKLGHLTVLIMRGNHARAAEEASEKPPLDVNSSICIFNGILVRALKR